MTVHPQTQFSDNVKYIHYLLDDLDLGDRLPVDMDPQLTSETCKVDGAELLMSCEESSDSLESSEELESSEIDACDLALGVGRLP